MNQADGGRSTPLNALLGQALRLGRDLMSGPAPTIVQAPTSASSGATQGARLRAVRWPARPSPAGRRTPRPHPARPPSACELTTVSLPGATGTGVEQYLATSPKTVDLADVHGRATACPFNSANEEARRSGGYAGSGHCQRFQEGWSGCDPLARSCFFLPAGDWADGAPSFAVFILRLTSSGRSSALGRCERLVDEI